MLINESWINATEGYRLGESDLYEPFTDNVGKLFKALQREYGKCVSKVYIEPDAKPIGWVFQKLQTYTDCNKTYLLETWVTLHDDKPTIVKTEHYHYL